MDKKNILTYQGLKKLEDELQELKVVRRKEVAAKIKEAREQGDLSENAEYDAAKDEQRDIELRIEELEKLLSDEKMMEEMTGNVRRACKEMIEVSLDEAVGIMEERMTA